LWFQIERPTEIALKRGEVETEAEGWQSRMAIYPCVNPSSIIRMKG